MKFNPKIHINIEDTVKEFIDKMNSFCVENQINKLYEISIKDDYLHGTVSIGDKDKKTPNQKTKTILFTVADLDTRERITLLSVDYKFKNPSAILTSNYKKALYKELFFNIMLGFSFNFENIIKAEKAEEALATVTNFKSDDEVNVKDMI